jgi:hypothetical protein
MLIGQPIRAHADRGDDVDGQRREIQTAMATEAQESSFHQRRRIFSHVEQHVPGISHGEGVQTGRAPGHRDGHIQTHPAFAAFGPRQGYTM